MMRFQGVPGVNQMTQAAAENPGLTRVASVIVGLIIAGAVTVVAAQPNPPRAGAEPPTEPTAVDTQPVWPGATPTTTPPQTPLIQTPPSPPSTTPNPTSDPVGNGTPSHAPEPANGKPITIDARPLTAINIAVSGITSWLPADQLESVRLLPGSYDVLVGYDTIAFTVTSQDTVTYDASADAYLDGRDSSTLVIRGMDVTIDARQLTGMSMILNYLTSNLPLSSTHTVRVVPGSQMLQVGNDTIAFTVTPQDTVTYDASADAYLDGRDSSTLVIRGMDVTIDARPLTAVNFFISYLTPYLDPTVTHTIRVVPGYQQFEVGYNIVGFTVTPQGTITYDGTEAAFVSGQGTSTLVVQGFPVAIDARALTGVTFSLNFISTALDPATVQSLRLVPGEEILQTSDGAHTASFTITPTGTVDYDPILTGIAGRGTTTLTVAATCCH
jgi:hypothetical protein